MLFDEYKQKVIDVMPISDGLEFYTRSQWPGMRYSRVQVNSISSTDSVVKLPDRRLNCYGNIVPVMTVVSGVLCANPNMTDLILPSIFMFISDGMLTGCSKLKRMTFPKNITRIPKNTFTDCTSLEDIYYEGTREEWDKIDVDFYIDKHNIDWKTDGLHCKVTTIRYPELGNEPLRHARIHFNCDLGDCAAEKFGVYCGKKQLPTVKLM